jgi:hypothetical protein
MTDPSSNRPLRLMTFRFLACLIVLASAIGGDRLLGLFQDTSMLREQSRLFREEVANLDFTTRNIVPNIDHAYYGVERPEGSELIPERSPRFFRTTSQGTVSSSGDTGKEVVLFLGGSTTECNEVDEQYRFPAVVARLLNDAGASVKTINGGVRGHTTQDSINALLNRPGFREADVIVLMENINDRM